MLHRATNLSKQREPLVGGKVVPVAIIGNWHTLMWHKMMPAIWGK
jgi:hypothetical protein